MSYKYIKSISYAIGTIERKSSKEEILKMRKKYQIRQQKEVSATAR